MFCFCKECQVIMCDNRLDNRNVFEIGEKDIHEEFDEDMDIEVDNKKK